MISHKDIVIKKSAFLVCGALIASMLLPCYAEQATPETAAAVQENVSEKAVAASTEKAEQQVILSELSSLTEGLDYKENCVLLHISSESEAQRVAAQLDAQVIFFMSGSATLLCKNSVLDTMERALLLPDDFPLLYPNYIYRIQDDVGEVSESISGSDKASGAALYNDPALGTQWYHNYIGSTAAWTAGITGAGVTVAVLDSGVMPNHPDLQVAQHINCLGPWSAEGGNTAYDTNGHGTAVAGVIAATANNGIGGVGIAPGVTLISCKTANSTDDFYDDTLNWGIHSAVDAGADVINISCDFPSDNNGYLAEAIAYAKNHGCVIIASAGNDGTNTVRYLPAHSDVIGVGALDTNGGRASYSNFGANVNIMAPGTSLYTTGYNEAYNPYFGATSGAAAVVSGAVALAISADPSLRVIAQNGTGDSSFVRTVEEKIYGAAVSLGDALYCGYGAVNVTSLLNAKVDTAKIESFVTQLYKLCLDRSPDSTGLQYWVSALSSGQRTGSEVAYGFIFSTEFRAKNYCNTDYIKQLYRAFLGRGFDQGGLSYWLSQLENGSVREEIFNGFVQSSEFKSLCSDYGIAAGSAVAVPAYGTVPTGACSVCGEIDGVTAFVTRLYRICLNRAPDNTGRTFWCNALWNHTESGSGVAKGFIFSSEFTSKKYSDSDYVEYLYKAILGRSSDSAGKASWLKKLSSGTTRTEIFDGFVRSTEFESICHRYGIVCNSPS